MNNILNWLATIESTRRRWQVLLAVLDGAGIVLATILTYYARFEGVVPHEYARFIAPMILLSCAVYVLLSWTFGLYRVVLRYVGIDTLVRCVGAVLCSSAVLVVADIIASLMRGGLRPVPFGVVLIQGVLALLVLGGIRITVRAGQHVRSSVRHHGERLVIVGAGSAGTLLLRELQMRPELQVNIAGFVDDNPRLRHAIIGGIPVLGPTSELEDIIATQKINQVFVALPSADEAYVRALLNRVASLGVTTRIMPKIVVERGKVSLSDMRQVNVEDLLGRDLTPIDTLTIEETIAGKVVAVTGAAGSIGSELCRQIMHLHPQKLLLFEIDESRLYELWFELESIQPGIASMHLLDIRDENKANRLFHEFRPDVVLHAAAYKHVPLMELEPNEAVHTNVLGTERIMRLAGECGAQRFVLISTDKAVAPLNVMGKTKQLSERLMLTMQARFPDTIFVAVRFGNVLGSRGSVVPIFEEKLMRSEPLTVTHEDVTRYFMVIPEAARLVLQAQAIGQPGDLFVLEMGEPVKIVDLARKMITLSGIPTDIVFTGLRPGEKLHESLYNETEEVVETSCPKINRVVHPDLVPLTSEIINRLAADVDASTLSASEVMSI